MKSRLILMAWIALTLILLAGSHPARINLGEHRRQASILPGPAAAGPALTVNAAAAKHPISPIFTA